MDPVTAALSQAWLQSVSRLQSQSMPDPTLGTTLGAPKTMVDLFERVLLHADPQAIGPTAGKTVDRLV